MLQEAQVRRTWPAQLLLNFMAMLAKASGGERCIAKTSMLYRLWTRSRRGIVAAWEAAHAQEFDAARSGSSAYLAAALRAFFLEVGRALGFKVTALLWDLEKFVDTVDLELLVRRAFLESYPPLDLCMGL